MDDGGKQDAGLEETIGRRIARAREVRGLSRPELALRLGLSAQAVEAVETGKTKQPSFKNGLLYARALGVTPEFLAGLTDEMVLTEPSVSRLPTDLRLLVEDMRKQIHIVMTIASEAKAESAKAIAYALERQPQRRE
jgi:transcriptional regulator with XRE-family HTH domain